MADHSWPASLPCFQVAGFSGAGEDGVLRSRFPAGTKIRPEYTSPPPEQITAAVVVDQAQLQTLMDFWAITLRRVLPFNHTDPSKPDDTPVEYRFLARPQRVPHRSGRRWRVTLQLEQLTTYQGTFPLGDGGGALLGDGAGNAVST